MQQTNKPTNTQIVSERASEWWTTKRNKLRENRTKYVSWSFTKDCVQTLFYFSKININNNHNHNKNNNDILKIAHTYLLLWFSFLCSFCLVCIHIRMPRTTNSIKTPKNDWVSTHNNISDCLLLSLFRQCCCFFDSVETHENSIHKCWCSWARKTRSTKRNANQPSN